MGVSYGCESNAISGLGFLDTLSDAVPWSANALEVKVALTPLYNVSHTSIMCSCQSIIFITLRSNSDNLLLLFLAAASRSTCSATATHPR